MHSIEANAKLREMYLKKAHQASRKDEKSSIRDTDHLLKLYPL
jgi:hypothetical protein